MAGYKKCDKSNWIRMYLNITVDVPCVFRDTEPFCPVRFYESHILRRHPVMIPTDAILKYCFGDTIPVCAMTPSECEYFNDLTTEFSMTEFTVADKLFPMSDVVALWKFVTISATASNGVNALNNIAGFVTMADDNIILPYVISPKDGRRYVPTFFFEDNIGVMQPGNVFSPLLPYLKLCCYILGVRRELVEGGMCKVVSLDQAKKYLPPGENFEDVWPMSRVMEKVEVVDENSASLNWLLDSGNRKD